MTKNAAKTPRTLRFPCGHLEDESSVNARTLTAEDAAWVACRRCNLVALTVDRPAAIGARRRRGPRSMAR